MTRKLIVYIYLEEKTLRSRGISFVNLTTKIIAYPKTTMYPLITHSILQDPNVNTQHFDSKTPVPNNEK